MLGENVVVKVGHLYVKRVLKEDARGLFYVEIDGKRAYVDYIKRKDYFKVVDWSE